MVVNWEEVWREVSNYLEGDVDPALRSAIEEHVRGCKGCTAVLDGTRNVVQLFGDDRMIEVPLGFSHRMQRRFKENKYPGRRNFFGWLVAAAAAGRVGGGGFGVPCSFFLHPLSSLHAPPRAPRPP